MIEIYCISDGSSAPIKVLQSLMRGYLLRALSARACKAKMTMNEIRRRTLIIV